MTHRHRFPGRQQGSRTRSLPALFALSFAISLASACSPPPLPPRVPTPPPPAPVTPPQACVPEVPRLPQTSLLEHVPATASFAAVLRRNSLAWLERAYANDPLLAEQMRMHFTESLGVDLTAAQGLLLLTFTENNTSAMAVFIHVPSISTLKGTVRGLHRDIPLVELDSGGTWIGASLREGIWLGHEAAVRRALDHELDRGTSLFLDVDGPEVDVLGYLRFDNASDRTLSALSTAFGIDHAVFKLDDKRHATLLLQGKDGRVEQAHTAFTAAIKLVLDELSTMSKPEPGRDPWTTALGMFAYHQVRKFAETATPKVRSNALVSEYDFGTWLDSAPLGAAAAALTVPAVLTQVTRGRTGQARTELTRVVSSLITYHEATKPATRKRNTLPPVAHVRIGRTPRSVPCGTEVRWDEDAMAAWQELGYVPSHPMRYTLEVGPPRSFGRREPPEVVLMVRAEGDLDCDGVLSRFDQLLQLDEDGNLVPLGDVEVHDETE